MAANRKRGRELNKRKPSGKKAKVQHVVSLGHSCNLNARHVRHFRLLSNLITKSRHESKVTNDKSHIFNDIGASHGIYLEWKKESDSYYLWGCNRSKGLQIKFELLSAIEDSTSELKIKRPVLAFSEGFGDGNEWGNIKTMLYELFGTSPADVSVDSKPDHVYAFTRTGDKFQFRVFKIQSMPTLGENSLILDEVLPLFIFRPIQINSNSTTTVFLDKNKFSLYQRTGVHLSYAGTCLSYACGYYDQYPTTTLHDVHDPNICNFRLSAPRDLSQWEGFNTNLAEYFERYYAFKKTKVPGTGPGTGTLNTRELIYSHLCSPYKMFARSLIKRCRENFDKDTCFETIDEDKIFFRGNTLAILNVDLVKYTPQKAEQNLKKVGELITRKLVQLGLAQADFPVDLQRVLRLLANSPLKNLQIITDNVAWMAEVKKISMVDDLFQDFITHLKPYQQIDAGKKFPTLVELQKRICRNWLMYDCRTYNIDPMFTSSRKNLLKYFKDKRKGLLWMTNQVWAQATKLNAILQCFRTTRNA